MISKLSEKDFLFKRSFVVTFGRTATLAGILLLSNSAFSFSMLDIVSNGIENKQQKTSSVKGHVEDAGGEPLIGVTVTEQGTRPLQNLTSFSIILVFEYNWLTCSLYF